LENSLQHADDRAVGAVHAFVEPTQPVEVTEELVGTVDEMQRKRLRLTRTFWSTTLYFGALSKGSNAVFQALEPGEITYIHFPFRLKKSLK